MNKKTWLKFNSNKKQTNSKSQKLRWLAVWGGIIMQSILLLPAKASDESLSYGQLIQKIKDNQVSEVILNPTTNTAEVTLNNSEESQIVSVFEKNNNELIKLINQNQVDFELKPSSDNVQLVQILGHIMLLSLLIGGLALIIRRSAQASGQAMSFGKSRARFHMEAKTGVKFEDVAGIEEAKEELQEIITFLKKPEKFTAVGAKIPRGMLLVGPPGTGKTLMAKAIAGEAGVPFFSISGSEFVEMFVGVGASRVRDLFKKAKENAPCLIFIDEIDAVGRRRGVGIGGGNDEREQTLNQLLTEMDGFEGNNGIIIIAATNRPDVLDQALLRPGRFDRRVLVDYPDYRGRVAILEVHSRNKKLAKEVSIEAIARRTPGFTGADLANLLNEAAIYTARRRKSEITMIEINDAIDRVVAGMEGTSLVNTKTKRLIAYHELGHAIVATLTPGHYPVEKVTLIPRGRNKGLTWFTPDEELGLESRAQILARITSILGGRAAEDVVFGDAEVTSYAADDYADDIKDVTSIVRKMVTKFGMSDLGPIVLQDNPNSRQPGESDASECSEYIIASIDIQIRTIIKRCYQEAKRIIQENRSLIDYLVDVLIEEETIEGETFRRLVEKYKEKQPKILSLSS